MKKNLERTVPKKISPSPIIQAIVEIRFDSEMPGEAIFGLAYSGLKSLYPSFDKLPIMQLPEALRQLDPNLKFKPHYRLFNENYSVHIGPKVLAVIQEVAQGDDYLGWESFKEQILKVLTIVESQSIVNKPSRLGVRYINFFESNDVFEKVKVSLTTPFDGATNRLVSFSVKRDSFECVAQVSSAAQITMRDASRDGSLIDLDVYSEVFEAGDFFGLRHAIETGHDIATDVFFGLLEEDFLRTLNPEY